MKNLGKHDRTTLTRSLFHVYFEIYSMVRLWIIDWPTGSLFVPTCLCLPENRDPFHNQFSNTTCQQQFFYPSLVRVGIYISLKTLHTMSFSFFSLSGTPEETRFWIFVGEGKEIACQSKKTKTALEEAKEKKRRYQFCRSTTFPRLWNLARAVT